MAKPGETSEVRSQNDWGGATHWSAVLAAGQTASPRGAAALEELCHTYWQPVFYYVRRLGHGPEDSQDLTQEFFARLLQKKYLKVADPEKGRFRSFLLVMLKGFLANARDRNRAQKRGGGREALSLDEQNTEGLHVVEPVDGMTPDKAFDRRWALTLLERVLTRLETELAAAGKADLFRELKAFLTGERSEDAYADIAGRLHLKEGALRVTVHRLRQRYRELLRDEIAQTVANPSQIDDELRSLAEALRG